jgi:hypothetical protein
MLLKKQRKCKYLQLISQEIILMSSSIYQVHDEVKDRMFELELSWVGKRK